MELHEAIKVIAKELHNRYVDSTYTFEAEKYIEAEIVFDKMTKDLFNVHTLIRIEDDGTAGHVTTNKVER